MHWLILIIAGVCEIFWAVGLKYSDGFRQKGVGAVAILVNIVSVVLLARAMKVMPVGTAYAVWTGIGAIGTAALGMWLFGEPRNAPRLLCMGLIILGMIGLEVFGGETSR